MADSILRRLHGRRRIGLARDAPGAATVRTLCAGGACTRRMRLPTGRATLRRVAGVGRYPGGGGGCHDNVLMIVPVAQDRAWTVIKKDAGSSAGWEKCETKLR